MTSLQKLVCVLQTRIEKEQETDDENVCYQKVRAKLYAWYEHNSIYVHVHVCVCVCMCLQKIFFKDWREVEQYVILGGGTGLTFLVLFFIHQIFSN